MNSRGARLCIALIARPLAVQAAGLDLTIGSSVTSGGQTTPAALASI